MASIPMDDAITFARDRLGPASLARVNSPDGRAAVQRRLDQGATPSSAALGAVFEGMHADRELLGEFVHYFHQRALGVRIVDLYPGLRRILDTGDLAQSVMEDLLPDLAELEFRSEGQFLSYLVTRMKWKAADGSGSARMRRETALSEPDPAPAGPLTPETGESLRGLIRIEEREELLRRIHRLPARDCAMVRAFLRDEPAAVTRERLGLSEAAHRKALQRALQALRDAPHA